jgi:preprotein translocase subunit SecG
MTWLTTSIIVLSVFAIVLGLMLSSSGSTTGLTAMNGQDLELFKKTKDRGLVKILQVLMYLVLLTILILVVANAVIGLDK